MLRWNISRASSGSKKNQARNGVAYIRPDLPRMFAYTSTPKVEVIFSSETSDHYRTTGDHDPEYPTTQTEVNPSLSLIKHNIKTYKEV
jgi:hypothetical protein